MIVSRESIKQELDALNEDQLKLVADFIASVKQHSQNSISNPWQGLFDSLQLFSDDFMAIREQPLLDVRESF
jgi:hypothetical protein